MRRLASFRRLNGADRLMLLEASALLGLARVAIRLMPFSKIAPRLGRHMAETPALQSPVAIELSRRVRRAISIASRNLPWESVCLPQAIAATLMLRRRGVPSTLYLGVVRESSLVAHAWVRVGGVVVTGDNGRARYTVVSTFA